MGLKRLKIGAFLLAGILMAGCGETENVSEETQVPVQETVEESKQIIEENQGETEDIDYASVFKGMKYAESYKGLLENNPIMTQRFGADPYAMVYGDTVYFYMTADAFEYDANGEVVENTYSKIRSINVVSTKDMVNFTDHGSIPVAGKAGIAKWANNSWAPAACWKNIDGKDQFFLYFADNGGGIGVLQGDSPIGPWGDPLQHGLITRQMPNCGNVLWLFDPAVLVDDDGRAYIYFGGGVPEGKISAPGTGRVAELGDDMISIKGEAVAIDIPYLFEDSGIHKFGNKYYYTYCTNWQVDQEGTDKYGFHNAEIACLESDSPMGPFTYKETILKNPGTFCGWYGNNHHCVFSFKDQWYITYHSRILEKKMGIEHGYRCTNIDEFEMGADGTIGMIAQTADGRKQITNLSAKEVTEATTAALMAGLETVHVDTEKESFMVLSGIDEGDFVKVQGIDFGSGVSKIKMWICPKEGVEKNSVIQIKIDKLFNEANGYLPVKDINATGQEKDGFMEFAADLDSSIEGIHDLFFVFAGKGYEVKSWCFE